MLRSLHIRNYVLIDSLDIDFPEGLVIITGQTGAGKSILMGALSLLTGVKADASVISEGASDCVVEGEFTISDEDGTVASLLEENDVEWDDGNLLIRRVVHRSGRSRVFINDSPATAPLLSSLSSRLVDIHSQHQSILLTSKAFQLSLLDHFAQCSRTAQECSAAWRQLQSTLSRLEEARRDLARLSSDRDYNETRFNLLDKAGLQEGELEHLEEEHKLLSNAKDIVESLYSVHSSLGESGNDFPSSLKDAVRTLGRLSAYMPGLAGLSSRLESVRIETDDILQELVNTASSVELSGERLTDVEARISLLYDLMHRFSCHSVEDLIAERDSLSARLYDSDSINDRIEELEKQASLQRKTYDDICAVLSEKRKSASGPLAGEIHDSLAFLELEQSRFSVEVLPCAEGVSGKETVEFRFSSTGGVPVDVAKCASGGELSRIMLSIKALMARYTGMPTMVFDEIDTGVSGSTADRMGSMICRMGNNMQVFSITHLPQVAAKGNAHYLVTKDVAAGRTSISRIEGESRVTEIARLLSGASITAEAVANARSLLDGE